MQNIFLKEIGTSMFPNILIVGQFSNKIYYWSKMNDWTLHKSNARCFDTKTEAKVKMQEINPVHNSENKGS